MKHLGDITKINGAEIPVVDIITGGSPCQDLSVAGLRKGLQHNELGDEETTRSGLFMDQLRIVKEMRANDVCNGRSGIDVRPRYMVWENVPGAFSVNQGKDFQAVLTEIVRVIEPTAPDVPLPDKGWPYAGCVYDELGGWSIAYRVHDAQFWGVPQRRRRIALVADFNGLSAAEILFDPQLRRKTESSQPDKAVRDSGTERRPKVQPLSQSLSGHFEPSGEAREGTAGGPAEGADGTGAFEIDQQGEKGGANYTVGVAPTIASDSHGTPHAVSFQERAGGDGGVKESSCRMSESEPCQPSTTSPSSPEPFGISPYDSEGMKSANPTVGFYKAETSKTLDITGGNPSCNQGGVAVVASIEGNGARPSHKGNGIGGGDVSFTLNAVEQHGVAYAVDCRNGTENPFVNGTLQAKEQGMNLNSNNVVRVPDQTAFRTQDADGGMRATQQKPFAHLWGRRNESKPCPAPTLTIRNPNGSTTETERGTV